MDNISLQADEVEALSCIYGEDWQVINPSSRTYAIDINDESTTEKIILQVSFLENYPLSECPTFVIHAPWLRGNNRLVLQSALEETYVENMGSSIIYLWVEKIRDLLRELVAKKSEDAEQPGQDREEDDDPEWDPNTLGHYVVHKKSDTTSDVSCERVPEIYTGGIVEDRKSVFQPHIAAVTSIQEVDLVMAKLKENKKIAMATHNIIAYRIIEEDKSVVLQGCEDDGEHHAGARMLHLLQIVDARNVLVIVTRWYGGIHLGPDRFKHINNCTREVLVHNGYIPDTSGSAKKGKHKS